MWNCGFLPDFSPSKAVIGSARGGVGVLHGVLQEEAEKNHN